MIPAHHHRDAAAAIGGGDLVGAARREGLDRHRHQVGRLDAQRLDALVDQRGLDLARRAGLEDGENERRHRVGRRAFAESGPDEGDVPHLEHRDLDMGQARRQRRGSGRRRRANARGEAARDTRDAGSWRASSAASGWRVARPVSTSAKPRRCASARPASTSAPQQLRVVVRDGEVRQVDLPQRLAGCRQPRHAQQRRRRIAERPQRRGPAGIAAHHRLLEAALIPQRRAGGDARSAADDQEILRREPRTALAIGEVAGAPDRRELDAADRLARGKRRSPPGRRRARARRGCRGAGARARAAARRSRTARAAGRSACRAGWRRARVTPRDCRRQSPSVRRG